MLPRAWQGGSRWTNASTGVCGSLGHILLTLPSTLEGEKKDFFQVSTRVGAQKTSHTRHSPSAKLRVPELNKDPSPEVLLVGRPSPAKMSTLSTKAQKKLISRPHSCNISLTCAAVKLSMLQPGENNVVLSAQNS